MRDIFDRLRDRIRHEDRGYATRCWIWTATTSCGYGLVHYPGRRSPQLLHRIAYETFVGPIPEGLQLDHLCNQRACCNPDHLEPVTPLVNTMRSTAASALNAVKTHCKYGHEFTAENTYRRPDGKRDCNTCRRARSAGWRTPRKAVA